MSNKRAQKLVRRKNRKQKVAAKKSRVNKSTSMFVPKGLTKPHYSFGVSTSSSWFVVPEQNESIEVPISRELVVSLDEDVNGVEASRLARYIEKALNEGKSTVTAIITSTVWKAIDVNEKEFWLLEDVDIEPVELSIPELSVDEAVYLYARELGLPTLETNQVATPTAVSPVETPYHLLIGENDKWPLNYQAFDWKGVNGYQILVAPEDVPFKWRSQTPRIRS